MFFFRPICTDEKLIIQVPENAIKRNCHKNEKCTLLGYIPQQQGWYS